ITVWLNLDATYFQLTTLGAVGDVVPTVGRPIARIFSSGDRSTKESAMHEANWTVYVLLAVFWLVFVLWRAGSR
ncbi:MAG: hypothetical protein KJZ98_15305, partial [Burkholderiaceae bacterium]|nr:hypothetical protein [Burkholderiaceae bacterium]